MAEYVNKELLLSQMGLVGDETKYGNRDAEHQSRSYSTWMGYEIMDSIDDCVEEDVVHVVRCKDCKWFVPAAIYDPCECVKWRSKWGIAYTTPEGYCHYGERKNE